MPRNSELIMWDGHTETWWQQITGEGIIGQLAGHQLAFIPAQIISWVDFKANNPEGSVLARETGTGRRYGVNPYAGYDRVDNPPFLYDGVIDGRLLPKKRVVTVTIGDVEAAFPFSVLVDKGTVNYNVGARTWRSSSSPAPVPPWTPAISPIPMRLELRRCLKRTWMERSTRSRMTVTKLLTKKPAASGASWARP